MHVGCQQAFEKTKLDPTVLPLLLRREPAAGSAAGAGADAGADADADADAEIISLAAAAALSEAPPPYSLLPTAFHLPLATCYLLRATDYLLLCPRRRPSTCTWTWTCACTCICTCDMCTCMTCACA